MVFFASLFQASADGSGVLGLGALLTERPAHAAKAVITSTAAMAEKINEAAESANVLAGLIRSFMAKLVSPWFALVEQPRHERRSLAVLACESLSCN